MNDVEKKYYSIGEIANSFGVSTSLVRYWEKKFKQLRPKKSQQGIRKYTSADLEQFKAIFQLVKEKGYTLRGAQEVLKRSTSHSSKKQIEAIQNLKEIRNFLQLWQQKL